LKENQIVINLRERELQYFQKLVKLPKVIEFFKLGNQTETAKIQRILTYWLFYSAKLGKHPLLSFDNWYKNRK
jgi:hypothetical protein